MLIDCTTQNGYKMSMQRLDTRDTLVTQTLYPRNRPAGTLELFFPGYYFRLPSSLTTLSDKDPFVAEMSF